MTNGTLTFTVTDAREMDGDAYDVAHRAFLQLEAILEIFESSMDGARCMARNAEMERQLYYTSKCEAEAFEQGPQARALDGLLEEVKTLKTKLNAVGRASSYNPKKPPKQ